MKKFERIAFVIVAIVSILMVLLLVTLLLLFLGNPVSYALVTARTHIHLWLEYPQLDLRMDRITYDFIHGGYTAYFSSPASIDTYCRLVCDGWGNIYVDYADTADSKYHTLSRIEQDYIDAYESAITVANFSFEENVSFCRITLENGNEHSSINKDFGITREDVQKLELDKEYDFREFAAKYGRITFYARDPEVTAERAAEILLELKAYLDQHNIPFYAIDFTLRNVTYDDQNVEVVDILWDEIYEEGLIDRVKEYNNRFHAHYDEPDAEEGSEP